MPEMYDHLNGYFVNVKILPQAVNDIHERGVVHCDISPSNVMFTTGAQHGEEEEEEGSTVLLDFGSALAEQPRGARWYQRSNWGTTGFVAPEVVAFGKCSHKIDVWSAGALIAFQVCSQHMPHVSC
jgi:serine/threonine protein kinase